MRERARERARGEAPAVTGKFKCAKWGCKKMNLKAMGKGNSKRCEDHKGVHL